MFRSKIAFEITIVFLFVTCHGNEILQKNQNLAQGHMNKLIPMKSINIQSEATAEDPRNILQEPYNANDKTSYVEFVLVVDNGVYKSMNESLNATHKYCKDLVNIVNSHFNPLNIFIALIDIIVWTDTNTIELSNEGNKTLNNFLTYRRDVLLQHKANDNAHLLTSITYDKNVVGKSYRPSICRSDAGGFTKMLETIELTAATMSHEIGHSFGMDHDTPECECEDESCIMTASSALFVPTQWSSCSINELNTAIRQGMDHCLKNVPKYLFDSPTCGNGFVEKGEECDCGLPGICKNSCCNPTTCKFRSNAICASGKCCDLSTCRPYEAGFRCRSSTGECDLSEFCDGNSEFCPDNYYKQDGAECGGGKAYCYKGSCKTHDDQCQLLWGQSVKSVEQCYEGNLEGSIYGNCGYNHSTNAYEKCSEDNINCGMLHCRDWNQTLQIVDSNVTVTSVLSKKGGIIIKCRAAIMDSGRGLVPDGAKCGIGKMCLNQKCISIDSLRTKENTGDCLNGCDKHGVCNNMGQCHCDDGFAPPLCHSPGSGGSIQSGPATNPNGRYHIYIIIIVTVILAVCSVVVFYFYRQKIPCLPTKSNLSNVNHRTEQSTHTHALLPQSQSAPTHSVSLKSIDMDNDSNNFDKSASIIQRSNNYNDIPVKPMTIHKPKMKPFNFVADKFKTKSEQCISMIGPKSLNKSQAASLVSLPTSHLPPKLTSETDIASIPKTEGQLNILNHKFKNSNYSIEDLMSIANVVADKYIQK